MRACVIVDGEHIERFAHEALRLSLARGLQVSCVFVCGNTTVPRKPTKHAAYYTYKLLFLNSHSTTDVPWRSLLPADVPVHHFESEWEGIWQRVPADAKTVMAEYGVDVIIRYGMTLLRDPDSLPATYGVFSFHHGDPAAYRGRPAGFYELLHGADHLGVIVQRLSNRLDAGTVLAYGAVKVSPHSYRSTLEAAYTASAHLLVKALRNARSGRTVDRPVSGRNYSLPDNVTVLRFCALLLRRKARRLVYGLLYEKRWRLALAAPVDLTTVREVVALSIFEELPVPDGYALQADPSAFDDRTVLSEALDRRSGRGRILAQRSHQAHELDLSMLGKGHLSYPSVVRDRGTAYLLPEMAGIGPQRLARIDEQLRIRSVHELLGLEHVRLTDPTLFHHEGRWWLFAGKPGSAADTLFLWSAEHVTGPYDAHPDSPIVIDPSRARMAGPVQRHDGRLFRLGQDNRWRYGDGIVVSEISQLTTHEYEEAPTAELCVEGRHGPHTLDRWRRDAVIIDVYDECRDPRAGLGRVRSRLRARVLRR